MNKQTIFFVLELIIFNVGLCSNLIAIIIFIRSKRLVNIGTRVIYLFLFLVDSSFLVIMVVDRASFYNGFDLITYSSLACKLYPYLNRILATLSPMLLVYISIERYVSLQDLTKRFVLRSQKVQLIYILIIIGYNSIYYSPCLAYFEIIDVNKQVENRTNSSDYDEIELKCHVLDPLLESVLPIMDLANRVIIPCFMMTLSSSLLIYSVHKSRFEVFALHERGSQSREIKFAITSISLNMFYVLLTLPLPVVLVFGNYISDLILFINFYLFCLSYALNFYILFLLNSLFRHEFYNLFGIKLVRNSEVYL